MLTIKDGSGRIIMTVSDEGKTIVEDKELEKEMNEAANKLKEKEAEQTEKQA